MILHSLHHSTRLPSDFGVGRLCNVDCTSKDNVLSHAAGAKHSRRVSAARAGCYWLSWHTNATCHRHLFREEYPIEAG